jgi:hypothetical protein
VVLGRMMRCVVVVDTTDHSHSHEMHAVRQTKHKQTEIRITENQVSVCTLE